MRMADDTAYRLVGMKTALNPIPDGIKMAGRLDNIAVGGRMEGHSLSTNSRTGYK